MNMSLSLSDHRHEHQALPQEGQNSASTGHLRLNWLSSCPAHLRGQKGSTFLKNKVRGKSQRLGHWLAICTCTGADDLPLDIC